MSRTLYNEYLGTEQYRFERSLFKNGIIILFKLFIHQSKYNVLADLLSCNCIRNAQTYKGNVDW